MVFLIVEGGPPAEIFRGNFHGLSQFRLVGQQELPPALAVLIAQPVGVLPFQGVDEGPHRPGVPVDLLHGVLQIGRTVGGEQTVRAGTLGHVFQVAAAVMGGGWSLDQLHALPGGDVFGVVSAAVSRLDVARLLDQPRHHSASC